MAEQFGEKQHDATPRRRQQAREQGQVARSQDLSSSLLLLGALATIYYYSPGIFQFMASLTRRQLEDDAWLTMDVATLVTYWNGLMAHLSTVMLPVFGFMVVVAIGVNVGQVGLLFLPDKLGFDIKRINPLSGVQRLFSLTNAMRLFFGIFKIAIVSAVAIVSVWGERDTLLQLSGLDALDVWIYLVQILFWTCVKIGFALFILAVLDYGYQKWKQEQDMRMTTQEMRDELKEVQGDPQVAARRKAVQRQLIMNRLGSDVKKSDVIVTNPTELAIAIQYDHETMSTPIVVAKGAGAIAQRIRRLGLEHGIPIVERKELARALYKQVEIGKQIPAEQYAAMAEVLRYVYELKGKTVTGG